MKRRGRPTGRPFSYAGSTRAAVRQTRQHDGPPPFPAPGASSKTAGVIADTPSTGHIEAGRHRLPIRVYFEDTDHTGIVYHANYLRYMERARTEMLRHAGVDHGAAMAADEGFWAVHAMNIIWHRPARIDDQLVVVTTVTKVRAAANELTHAVMRGEQLLCSATVTAAFLSMEGRPQRQSRSWHDRFSLLMAQAMTN